MWIAIAGRATRAVKRGLCDMTPPADRKGNLRISAQIYTLSLTILVMIYSGFSVYSEHGSLLIIAPLVPAAMAYAVLLYHVRATPQRVVIATVALSLSLFCFGVVFVASLEGVQPTFAFFAIALAAYSALPRNLARLVMGVLLVAQYVILHQGYVEFALWRRLFAWTIFAILMIDLMYGPILDQLVSSATRLRDQTRQLEDVNEQISVANYQLETSNHQLQEAKASADEANSKLQETLKRQQLLFSVIGHEIRTPASSIKMMLDEPGYLSNPNNLDVARRSAQHLISILDDMRALANPDLSLKGTKAIAKPRDVITDAVESQRVFAMKQSVAISIDLPQAFNATSEFNTQILRQIAINLVRNCLLHSQATRLDIVGRASGTDDTRLEVVFQDNGTGVAADAQATLFEPYERGESRAEGLGLGLHICREFLRKYLGGDLTYVDAPGGGAAFVMRFDVTHATRSQRTPTGGTYDFAGKHILLVEDHDTIREIARIQLSKTGAMVTEAKDGLEGLNTASARSFDLIITDLYMPEMEGDEMVRLLRGAEDQTPIVGITAATVTDDAVRFVQAGADFVLEKPMSVAKLQAKLSVLHKPA